MDLGPYQPGRPAMDSVGFCFKQVLAVILSASIATAAYPPPQAPAPERVSAATHRWAHTNPLGALAEKGTAHATASVSVSPTLTPRAGREGEELAKSERNPAAPNVVAHIPKAGAPNAATSPTTKSKVSSQLVAVADRGPIFVENKGQFDSRVKFRASNRGKTLWLIKKGIAFDFLRSKSVLADSPASELIPWKDKPSIPEIDRYVIQQDFVAANKGVVIETKGSQKEAYNYFSGSDSTKWQTNVHGYSEIVYHDVWDGVDVRLYG